MTIASITVSKTKGLFTGRGVETFYISFDDGTPMQETKFCYGWGFTHAGLKYDFSTNTRGDLLVLYPAGASPNPSSRPIKLGKKGGKIDLETWTKIKAR